MSLKKSDSLIKLFERLQENTAINELIRIRSFNDIRVFLINRINELRLSIKITLIYAAMLIVVLCIVSLLTTTGLYMSFYHQAQIAMEESISHTMEKLNRGDVLDSSFWAGDPVTQGVVLRVTDLQGGTIIENDPQFPSIAEMVKSARKNPPMWANQNFILIETHEAMIYYKRLTLERGGQIFYLHFFKTITLEKQFLSYMLMILFAVNTIGVFLALIVGYIVSNRILQPIRNVTNTAKSIEANNMDERLKIGSAHDEVTELSDTFNHMLDRLQESFRQQQQFVSDASHELRTPVTVILGYSDMLVRWGKEDEELLDEGITSIQSEANNMHRLIEELLFLARADQNAQTLIKAPTELSMIIDFAITKVQLKETQSIDVLINDAGEIYADRDAIEKMLIIFIDNGIKYSGDNGKVRIYSRRDNNCMKVSIEDNGVGIASEHHDKIFDRFYRVDSSRTKLAEGVTSAGLGLSIAKWIADQHEIKIDLESEIDAGTKITLTIPLASNKLISDADSVEETDTLFDESADEINSNYIKNTSNLTFIKE
ncbi:MAG: HAMP domain-containing protein [Selenomonadaceae bacterium]|nr:HAMP domain-containing protein [Selenomonadaceae bacterium]